MQPGEIVCLYDNMPGNTRNGSVLMSTTLDPSLLFDIPEGTRALLTRLPETDFGSDEDLVAEVFVDGITGYVHFINCVKL